MCCQELDDLVLRPRVVEPVGPRVRRVGCVVGYLARVQVVPTISGGDEVSEWFGRKGKNYQRTSFPSMKRKLYRLGGLVNTHYSLVPSSEGSRWLGLAVDAALLSSWSAIFFFSEAGFRQMVFFSMVL